MASLPSQASWRRSSPSEQTASAAAQESISTTAPTPLESTAVHLNSPLPSPQASAVLTPESASQSSTFAAPPPEPKRCWICQQDETEDTPESTRWRKPCPCSLDAHDSCLLEWVASEEAPKKGELAQSKKLLCPQCGTEIKIQRPRDVIVSLAEMITKIAKTSVVPTALTGILSCTYSGLWLYGYTSMNMVFGVEDTRALFGYAMYDDSGESLSWLNRTVAIVNPFYLTRGLVHPNHGNRWFIYIGLPLVAPALVLNRTKLLDQASALLLPFYFLNPEHRDISWPPTPGLAFAIAPYLKTAYNELYRYTFSELEKKWELAVQRKPREGETAEQIAAQAEEEGNDAVIGLEIGFDEVVEVEEDNEDNHAVPHGRPGDADGARVNAAPNQRNNNRNVNNQWNIEENISTSRIASTIMGALFFPHISSLMGVLLKHSLPRSWTFSDRLLGSTKGLLKEQWGRSLIGGCLFVVLKDAVMLYCKWRKARDFGKKIVLDYVPPKQGGKAARRRLDTPPVVAGDETPHLVPIA